MTTLAPTLQAFFTDRLIRQRHASAHTIAAYRDTLRLLLSFAQQRTGKPPSALDLADLDATLIAAFLDHLEHDRGNSPRTRNARLATIHSLFRFAALHHPEYAADIERVLAIPPKQHTSAIVTFLTETETKALLAAPHRGTWTGRRDHTLLTLATETGLRISELTSLTRRDIHLGTGAHLTCHGKGRKHRVTPLSATTVKLLRGWLSEHHGHPTDPLFPTRRGTRLSRDALEHRLAKYVTLATGTCPTLANKKITMHVLRHTAAMRLLQAGVDTSVIALWLGHENPATTQIYLNADLELKQRALDRTTPPATRPGRYHPPDRILNWLNDL